MPVSGDVYLHEGACGGQKNVSDPLELEFQAAVSCSAWELGTALGPLQEQCMVLSAEPF